MSVEGSFIWVTGKESADFAAASASSSQVAANMNAGITAYWFAKEHLPSKHAH